MKIGSVGGISVYIHWTFWILMAFYLVSTTLSFGIVEGIIAILFIGGIFACVVAHEFGHAAAAAMYGIPTTDITLLPIGGVARLQRMPDKPVQELVIALAGPAVNIVIAGLLFVLLSLGVIIETQAPAVGFGVNIMAQWIAANIFLAAFNMLPAFPMDGGRVLRSMLAMNMQPLRATQIAARVGRWMALAFVVAAIYYSMPMLILIAVFIFIAGTAELMNVRLRESAHQSQAQSPFVV